MGSELGAIREHLRPVMVAVMETVLACERGTIDDGWAALNRVAVAGADLKAEFDRVDAEAPTEPSRRAVAARHGWERRRRDASARAAGLKVEF